MFKDRLEAGQRLGKALLNYRDAPKGLVVGLPRGGVPVAAEVAKILRLPLDIVCPRKIGAPGNPEFAIGSVTESGVVIMTTDFDIPKESIEEIIQKETNEAVRRLNIYRKGLPERDFSDKCVIIVDDGLATGSTMVAAIDSIKQAGAATLIVAVPVSPIDTAREIDARVDDFICLETPINFQAVGQFYHTFGQTSDEEVFDLLHPS